MPSRKAARASADITSRLMEHFGRRGLGRVVEPVAGVVTDQTLRHWGREGIPLPYLYYIRPMYPSTYEEVSGESPDKASDRQCGDRPPRSPCAGVREAQGCRGRQGQAAPRPHDTDREAAMDFYIRRS